MTRTPLVFLPCLMGDAALWRHQLDSLGDLAEMTVADLARDDTIAGMARRVLDAAPARFALAGLSMGGYVAQEIMRRAPERVLRLALLDTAARADLPEQRERRLRTIELAERGRYADVLAEMFPLLVHPDWLADAALRQAVTQMAERVGPAGFIRQQTAIAGRPDGREDLRRVTCPTVLLYGRQDALTPAKVQEEMAANLPNARLVAIEECGHLSALERPHAVSAVLRYWLQDRG